MLSIPLESVLKARYLQIKPLNLVLRHATATDALITLREHWANVLEAIDGLKQNNLTIDQFISIAKTLLQIIIDSIRAEQDDSLSKTIRDSARFSADIIKTAQVRILVYYSVSQLIGKISKWKIGDFFPKGALI